jgi:hypothetical protein
MQNNFLKKIEKYGDVNKYDLLKVVAFFIMVVDHLGLYIFTNNFTLRAIGRASMPIFVMLYGHSYKRPNNQILICGIIMSIISAYFNYQIVPLNILYTMYFSGFLLKGMEKVYSISKPLLILIVISSRSLITPSALFIEYGLVVLYYMFVAVLIKKNPLTLSDRAMILILYVFVAIFMCDELFFRPTYCVLATLYLASLFLYLRTKQNSLRDTVNIKNKIIKNAILVCSRYSLYLYVIHITIYMLIAKCL